MTIHETIKPGTDYRQWLETRSQAISDASDGLYAIEYLGSLLRWANDGEAGFESIKPHHWAALGIAIEQLSAKISKELVDGLFEDTLHLQAPTAACA